MSPPAIAQSCGDATASIPRYSSNDLLGFGNFSGMPSATVAKHRPRAHRREIAELLAIARHADSCELIVLWRKCTPSTSASVVMTLRCERDGCQTAASSPMVLQSLRPRGRDSIISRSARDEFVFGAEFSAQERALSSSAKILAVVFSQSGVSKMAEPDRRALRARINDARAFCNVDAAVDFDLALPPVRLDQFSSLRGFSLASAE